MESSYQQFLIIISIKITFKHFKVTKNITEVNELWLNDQIRSIEELKPNKTYRSSTKHYEAVPFFLNSNKSQMKLIKMIQKKFCDESSKMKYNLICYKVLKTRHDLAITVYSICISFFLN